MKIQLDKQNNLQCVSNVREKGPESQQPEPKTGAFISYIREQRTGNVTLPSKLTSLQKIRSLYQLIILKLYKLP